MKIRVILADDHQIIREGLASLLENQADMQIIEQASDGLQAVRLSLELSPDLVIMDLTMPGMNGIEATHRITSELPQTKVLCLSAHSDTGFVSDVIDAGASGYLLKDCAFEELVNAIRIVIGNQCYLSPEIAGTLVEAYKAQRSDSDSSAFSMLTQREREVVQLLAEGQTTKEIAQRLQRSVKTIATHREHLMTKLNLDSLAALTKYAIREGLTTVES
ncbi:MAG: DNA-binding NarL/FixJ family response regulator [Arenicella sp.]|jgi:DNA-binding NarL/FixJ family response regulator